MQIVATQFPVGGQIFLRPRAIARYQVKENSAPRRRRRFRGFSSLTPRARRPPVCFSCLRIFEAFEISRISGERFRFPRRRLQGLRINLPRPRRIPRILQLMGPVDRLVGRQVPYSAEQ